MDTGAQRLSPRAAVQSLSLSRGALEERERERHREREREEQRERGEQRAQIRVSCAGSADLFRFLVRVKGAFSFLRTAKSANG